jgi:hypothetical protein
MLGKAFARFVEKSPISVMVRGTLERVLGAEQLDTWFARTAQKQYTRTVLFSTVYDVLSQVVFRIKPSVRAAYRDQEDQVGASLISLYNKLNGVETHTSAELVRYSAAVLTPLIAQLDGARVSWLPGYRVKIVDGNCLEASDRRLKALRAVPGGALPGKSLVVYEPVQGLVTDVFPCEDGHAQERSLFGAVLETVQADDLWIQDRNFCTCAFLCTIDHRGAGFITRQHAGLPFEPVHVLRSVGRIETGQVAEQRVQVREAQGGTHLFRRIRVKLDQATRDGDRVLYILTHLPLRKASAKRVARLYRKRWTLEVLQSQDIKFTRNAFFFLVDCRWLFFKGQHVMHFDRPVLIHHDFFHQELDDCLAVLIAQKVQVAPQKCAELLDIVRDTVPLNCRVALLFHVVPFLLEPFEPLGDLLAAGREIVQRNDLLLIRINEALQLSL